MARTSNTKLGVTVSAKDQASRDLKQVAKAFADTAEAATQANHDVEAPVTRSTTAIGQLKNAIGFAKTEAADLAPLRQLGGIVGRLGPVGAAAGTALNAAAAGVAAITVAASVAAVSVAHFAESSASAVEEQRVLAAQAATNVETLSRFGFAARTVGADLDDAQDALAELGQRAVNMPKDFERWGIATTNANGTLRTTRELLFAVSDRISQTASETERLALADELMSDVGRRLLPVLEQGSAGLASMFEEADRLGATIDSTSAIIAQRFVRQLRETETATNAVTRRVGGAFQPAVTEAFEAAEHVAAQVLERITENEEAFTSFATGSVALLARGFALLVETGSAFSHVAEGLVSVFTFRLGPAFDQARALAADVAQEARFLAGELERGAEVTRDEVVPAVDSERAARAELVKTLSTEKKAREDLRGAAGEAVSGLLDAQKAAAELGDSQREDAQIVAQAILGQIERLDRLEGQLATTKTSAADLAQAMVAGGAAAMRQVEAETQTRRAALRSQIAITRRALGESVAAAEELTKIVAEENAKRRAEEAKTYEAELRSSNAKLAAKKQNLEAEGRLEEEKRQTEALRQAQAEAEARNTQARIEQAGMMIVGSLRQAFEAVRSGSMSAGDAALGVLGSVANAAVNAAIAYGVQQAAIAATNALLGTQATTVAANTTAQVAGATTAATAQTTGAAVATGAAKTAAFSSITAAAAKAGAEAYAAYVGIPIVGPAVGAAAAAEAVAATMGFAALLAFNKGGLVPGVGTTDSVPAVLTPGELVVPREVTQALMGAGAMAGPPPLIIQPQMMLPTTQADFDRMLRDGLGAALERSGWRRA